MLNADAISGRTFSELTEEQINQIKESLGKDAQELRENIERVTTDYVGEWETYRDELISKYPEKQEYFENMYEQSKKVMGLTEKLTDDYFEEAEKLVAEGKTNEEVEAIMTERFSDEFRKAYGEDYIPPGFIEPTVEDVETGTEVEVIPIGEIDKDFFDTYDEGGGFVKDNLYTDPVTDYRYVFGDGGFSYTTPVGEIYNVEYPENYQPKTYSRGDEVYDYSYRTADGEYEYKYTSTGYEVMNPDGTTESFTYPEGTYEVVGGGKIEQKPTGFDYTPDEGAKITYDYNPEFKHYVASDGKVYVPPEGTSYHSQYTNYDPSGKTYGYSYGGETWKYNPESNKWVSSSGETYTPSAITGAPVGYEDKEVYITERGETWSYDSSTGTWKSSSGEEYSPPPSSYYSYDSNTEHYTDAYGNTYERSQFESSHEDYSGKTWSYDSNAGVWSSSSGESYNPVTGTTSDSSGQTTYQYGSGGYYSAFSGGHYTDAGGSTWSQNPDGTWQSSSGETKSTAEGYVGSQYQGGGGYDAAGNYVGGDYGGYTASGTYTGGNTYTQNTDGTWNDGGSTGTYSGGDSSGGSYSGGSTSGGDSGGTSSGGTGYATRSFEEETPKEVISRTSWEKYRLF